MNIVVCIKQVPDTTEIRLDPVTNNVVVGGTIANGMVDFRTTLPAGFTLPAVPAATMANFQVYRFTGVGRKLDTTFSGDGIQIIDNRVRSDELVFDDAHRALFDRWDTEDPPDAWERERNRRIAERQGNANPFIPAP